MLRLPVTIEVLSNIPTSSPSILVVTPPTSLTIIFPAAISHGSSLIVKYAPIIPSATCANSNAAEPRSEEHTSELQSRGHLVCRLLLEKKKKKKTIKYKETNHT